MPYENERHGPDRIVGPGFHAAVYRLVQRIPHGCVASYGDIAEALGLRSAARHVGNALSALPKGRADVPWHRVVSSAGNVSVRGDGEPSAEQVRALRREGVEVSDSGRIAGFAERRHHLRPVRRPRTSREQEKQHIEEH